MTAAVGLPRAVAASAPREPAWTLLYQGANVTADISAMVLSITYTDHLGHFSDDLRIELEDRHRKWQGPWFPAQGDLLSLAIGYAGGVMLPCGEFQVDELELSGMPDVFHLRCLAAWITPSIRTPKSVGYENVALPAIAQTVASAHGLTLVSVPPALNVVYARVTQKQETDLAFLRRLANEHNYDFSIRSGKLVFYARTALEAKAPAFTISRKDLDRFSFKAMAVGTYSAARVSYQHPATKALITQSATDPQVKNGSTLNLARRVENGQQAQLRAQAALHAHNMLLTTGELSGEGDPRLAAGVVTALHGFGNFDRNYLVMQSRHALSRMGGYTTSVQIRSVQQSDPGS